METKKILVIEDDNRIAGVMKTIFSIHKINAMFASCGSDALEVIDKTDLDLIISDIQLPDISGHEILERVRGNSRTFKVPFIFLTAFSGIEDVRKGMNQGADDYVTKPFTAQLLIDTIRARLNISARQNEMNNLELNDKWFRVLSSNFNHEFITPLNGILGVAEALRSNTDTAFTAQYGPMVDMIETSGHRILRNTRKLMLFSVISSKKIKLLSDESLFNPSVVITELLDAYKEKSTLRIDTYIENTGDITGNEKHTRMVFEELIDNAIKFSTGSIKLQLTTEGNSFVLKIINQSDCVTAFTQNDIDAFKKFHNDISMNGMGIGLYLCRELCSQMGLSFTINYAGKLTTAIISGTKAAN